MINLNELNPSQRAAAEAIDGPVLILAGAGSGKTRTVTYRIAHMISNLKISPKEILAVSFTNKAAQEMNERVRKLLGSGSCRGITLSTFHSLGIRILRNDIDKIGYNRDFTIYDQGDQMSIVREGLKRLKMDKASFDKKTILSKIGFLKNNGIAPTEFKDSKFFDEDDAYDIAAESVYHFYEEKLQFYNALDFDDILFMVVKLFRAHPEIARSYSERFKYIMIDEYQDTNGLQFEMIKGLTLSHNNICVVGDDDQSIYGFRGADISNILNFEKIFPGTKVIKLEENYRSTSKILNLANTIIKENKKRKDKTMFTKDSEGDLPELWMAGNTEHEAQIVIDDIVQAQLKDTSLKDMAILYRSNTQIPPFEDQLRLAGIPYKIIGGQKFYDKKEIKDLIAYLSFIANSRDELSLRRILNVPNRGIGNVTLKKFLEVSTKTNTPLFRVIEEVNQQIDHKKESLSDFLKLIYDFRLHFATMTLKDALQKLIDDIDYMGFIDKSYDSPKIAARKKDDVRNFLLSTERFEARFKEEATLEFYLERLLLADSQDNRNGEEENQYRNEITLMTLHSSKGLEFDRVYLAGMEEELLPHKNSINEPHGQEEERRLCYVGITRARKKLIMTYARERSIYGKNIKRFPSRFVIELKEDLIKNKDRTGFSHMTEEEEMNYKKDFFGDLLKSLD